MAIEFNFLATAPEASMNQVEPQPASQNSVIGFDFAI